MSVIGRYLDDYLGHCGQNGILVSSYFCYDLLYQGFWEPLEDEINQTRP